MIQWFLSLDEYMRAVTLLPLFALAVGVFGGLYVRYFESNQDKRDYESIEPVQQPLI